MNRMGKNLSQFKELMMTIVSVYEPENNQRKPQLICIYIFSSATLNNSELITINIKPNLKYHFTFNISIVNRLTTIYICNYHSIASKLQKQTDDSLLTLFMSQTVSSHLIMLLFYSFGI